MSPLTPRYLIACYTNDGDPRGYFTSRNTLTDVPAKALWAVSEKSATEEISRLKLETDTGWSQYVWVVEKVNPQDMGDARDPTPDRLMDGSSKKPAHSSHVVDKSKSTALPSSRSTTDPQTKTKESEMAQAKPATKKVSSKSKNKKPAPAPKPVLVKKAAPAPAPAPSPKAAPAAKKPTALEEKLAKIKAKARKVGAVISLKKVAAATSPKKSSAKSAPPSRRRVTDPTTLTKRTALQRPKNVKCLCGCGGDTEKYFLRGHVFKYGKYLRDIAAGELKPTKVFPAAQIKAMGPWTNTRAGGLRPKVENPARVRAALVA